AGKRLSSACCPTASPLSLWSPRRRGRTAPRRGRAMKQTSIAASCVCVLAVAAWSAAPPGARDSHGDPLPAGAVARLGRARLRHAGAVDSVLIGPRNALLSEGGGEVQLHDLASGRRLRRWRLTDEILVREGLCADGRTLALAGARGIRFLDLATGKERRLVLN